MCCLVILLCLMAREVTLIRSTQKTSHIQTLLCRHCPPNCITYSSAQLQTFSFQSDVHVDRFGQNRPTFGRLDSVKRVAQRPTLCKTSPLGRSRAD